jgi:hypothetical protein
MSAVDKPLRGAAELKALAIAELGDDFEPDALAIIPTGSTWCATLRANGSRTDEQKLTSVSAIGRRLAAEYALGPDRSRAPRFIPSDGDRGRRRPKILRTDDFLRPRQQAHPARRPRSEAPAKWLRLYIRPFPAPGRRLLISEAVFASGLRSSFPTPMPIRAFYRQTGRGTLLQCLGRAGKGRQRPEAHPGSSQYHGPAISDVGGHRGGVDACASESCHRPRVM